jgi:hypothetical protein
MIAFNELNCQTGQVSKKLVYELDESSGEEYLHERTLYYYDAGDRLIAEVVEAKEDWDSVFGLSRRTLSTYGDTLQRRDYYLWDGEEEDWQPFLYETFEYDENGCLEKDSLVNEGYTVREKKYYTDSTCKILSYKEKNWYIPNSFYGVKKTIEYFDTMKIEYTEEIGENGLAYPNQEARKRITTYDAEGRIIELWYNDSDFGYAHNIFNVYSEDHGELIFQESYSLFTSDFEKTIETNYSYEFSENGSKIEEQSMEIQFYPLEYNELRLESIRYEYDCFGRRILEEYKINGELSYREEIEYTDSELCTEIDSIVMITNDLNLFPNPTNSGQIYLDWNDWQGKEVKISGYSINGVLLFERGIHEIEGRIGLDLSRYNSKVIILRIETNEDVEIRKVLKR